MKLRFKFFIKEAMLTAKAHRLVTSHTFCLFHSFSRFSVYDALSGKLRKCVYLMFTQRLSKLKLLDVFCLEQCVFLLHIFLFFVL